MGSGEILLIVVVVLILFGPEDLPDILRTIGKLIFEIHKLTTEFTKEFTGTLDSSIHEVKKEFETSEPLRYSKTDKQDEDQTSPEDEALLHYDDDISPIKNKSKTESKNPLADLPSDMVFYEEKGASR